MGDGDGCGLGGGIGGQLQAAGGHAGHVPIERTLLFVTAIF